MATPRVWLVTGSSTGVGRAVVEVALSKGDRVVATLRKPSDVDALRAKYPETQLLVVKLDVTHPDEILDAFKAAKRAFGRVDVVFNNAGIGLFGEVEGTPDATARKILETNFWGAANVSREAVRFFREENPPGSGGRLLTVSSYAGVAPLPGSGYYSASKAGLEAINQALAGEINPRWNIKISLIVLGSVRTPIIFTTEVLPSHPSYTDGEAPAAQGRKLLKNARDSRIQSGDPVKTAHKIYELSTVKKPPLRLVIGLDSLGIVQAHLDKIHEELETYKPWSNSLLEERAGPPLRAKL
ncbi:SDR family oxidoreductase [Phanerochaete sordida]|uniref:SDR family oxidoreductase n=1 Tax=Phanerochaete sordida TaxID=48140 RepID=A0A9P3G4X1_9APHY|nr:SDR family oxidoreductase [Phanerochaete sordida]